MEMTVAVFPPEDFDEITEVWEESVRASHHFISEQEITLYRRLIRDVYLPGLHLFGIRTGGRIEAFAAVKGPMLEMLFVRPASFGRGLGSLLVDHATRSLGITRVDVNEENEGALGFYLKQGFRIVSREERDPQGTPHPVLHMER